LRYELPVQAGIDLYGFPCIELHAETITSGQRGHSEMLPLHQGRGAEMKKSRQAINEIIAKGMGLSPEFYCNEISSAPGVCAYDLDPSNKYYQDCLQKDPLTCKYRAAYPTLDAFTWSGFGAMMEWWYERPGKDDPYHLSGEFMADLLMQPPANWPAYLALGTAEHFLGEKIEMEDA
jgi:hypothetical protein